MDPNSDSGISPNEVPQARIPGPGRRVLAIVGIALIAALAAGAWVAFDNSWMNLIGPLILFTKIIMVAFLIFWFRFTYPRFREDQLQTFAWKYLIPLSLVNIAATAVLKVVF